MEGDVPEERHAMVVVGICSEDIRKDDGVCSEVCTIG